MNLLLLRRTILILIPLFLALSCQTVPEEQARADWSDVTIQASGNGLIEGEWTTLKRIRAIQHAKIDVYAKIESQIMSLHTGVGKRVRDWAEKDEKIRKKISAFVRGAKIVGLENGEKGIKVDAELYLGESFEATIGLAMRKLSPAASPGTRKQAF